MTWAADENMLIVNWALIAISLRRVGGPSPYFFKKPVL